MKHERLQTAIMENTIDTKKRIKFLRKRGKALQDKLNDSTSPNEIEALEASIRSNEEMLGQLLYTTTHRGMRLVSDKKE